MRKFSVSAVLLVLGLSVLAAPAIYVAEPVFDFGEVKEGLLVVHEFTITNVGDTTLHFTRQPGTSCGCTSAPLPKDSLAPGESVPLLVKFETTGYGGLFAKRYVYVYSNDPANPTLTLVIQGTVRPAEPFEESAYILRYRYRLILDVREEEAFLNGHLLGSVNIPAWEIAKISGLPQCVIYVYDEAGETGVSVAEALRRQGFWAARALSGGLAGWAREFGNHLIVGQPPEREPQFSPAAIPPARLAQEYVIILDFRDAESYEREHLWGAIHVGPEGLEALLPHLLPAAAFSPELQPYIFCVDEGAGVAKEAAQFLQALGLVRAYALVGGLEQWRFRYGSDFMRTEP